MGENKNLRQNKGTYNILLTNDDGIFADGIVALFKAFKDDNKYNLFVVAPETEQSGFSHKITLKTPLHCKKINNGNIEVIMVNGTPTDCAKLSLHNLYKDKIDLVISGINNGSNNGISIHYSGTVAAVIEGGFYKIPGIAASLYSYTDKKFDEGAEFIKKFVDDYIDTLIKRKSLLNINIPDNVDYSEKPLFCKMGQGNFTEDYVRISHNQKEYFWAGGPSKYVDMKSEDDDRFILNDRITITPIKVDCTDYDELNYFKS